MPIYEYECSKGHRFEQIERLDAPKTRRCVVVGCDAWAKRVLSLGSFILKGLGWAKDGYSKKDTDE